MAHPNAANITPRMQTASFDITLNGTELHIITGVISDHVSEYLDPIIAFSTLPFSVLGVITNIINVRVFIEQGIRNDSTNIGLVCLSICDLLGCATIIPFPICFLFKYMKNMPYYYSCVTIASLFPQAHIPLQQMGAWITVYISLIRCLCVLFPLKVKLMFTPTRTIIVITFIFLFFGIFQCVFSSFVSVVWVFVPQFNTSIATIRESKDVSASLYYKQLITNQILPAIAVIVVSVNTVLMGQKLVEVKKWRLKNSAASSSEPKDDSSKKPLASKEIELIKLINTVTSIFLVCFLMGFVPSIAVMVFPDVRFSGVNRNLFYFVFLARFLFDVINSSINFFFYMRVSSRYKAAFATSFKWCLGKDAQQQ